MKNYFLILLLMGLLTSCKAPFEAYFLKNNQELKSDTILATQTVQNLHIIAGENTNWTISTNVKWLTFSSNSGIGSSKIIIDIKENKKGLRKAQIFIKNNENANETTILLELIQNGYKIPPTKPGNWFEIPENNKIVNTILLAANIPDQEIRNYTMLYDTINKFAYWIAYPLSSNYLGNSGRSDEWGYNPYFPISEQAYLKRGFKDYSYDRGHQVPSGDRTSSRQANATTFYYTNITPQNKKLNQSLWNNLENKVRTWSRQCDTLYVVTGAAITENNKVRNSKKGNKNILYTVDNKGDKIAIPKYYYKALVKRKGNNYSCVAFKIDNRAPESANNYKKYRLSVKELEKITGFTFFPQIPNLKKDLIYDEDWK